MINKKGYFRDIRLLADHAAYSPEESDTLLENIFDISIDYKVSPGMVKEHVRCAINQVFEFGEFYVMV